MQPEKSNKVDRISAFVYTVYILVAIGFEKRDLLEAHGQAYADYRDRVPMLIPFKRDRA